jgi:hypothetical protein
MNKLQFSHPSVAGTEGTSLTQQAASGDSTLTVINTKGFVVNKNLLVGSYGSEDSEIVKTHGTTAPTDTLITLVAALKFSHSTDTPVTILDYDQIEVSRASAKGGTYSVLATVDITPDEETTAYKDATGSSTDYYKIRYKDSIATSYSGYSSEIPATGFADSTLAGMITAVYRLFSKHSEKILDRDEVIRWLNEGAQKLYSKVLDLGIDWYIKYGTDGSGAKISFVANQRAYDLSATVPDFVRAKRWQFTYDNVSYYFADPMDETNDFPNTSYSRTFPRYFYEGKSIVPRPLPTASTGGMRPIYVYMPARMVNDDDVPELPLAHQTAPINYALKRAFESDNKFDTANYYGTLFENDAQVMLSEIKSRYPEMPQTIPMFGAGLEDNELHDGFVLPS